MLAIWYYLEEDDESKKKGPFTLEYLIENAPSDCLISNNDMLQSDTPWLFLSELNDSNNDDNDTLITSNNNKNNNIQNKSIRIKIQHTNNGNAEPQPTNNNINIVNNNTLIKEAKKSKEEEDILTAKRKKQEEKLKKQVLDIEKDEKFDEEWFILCDSNTNGPYTRWELVKQFNENKINQNTIIFLNGSKEFRYLKMCGELRGVFPFIDRNATIQHIENMNDKNIKLTKNNLENKQWLYKDPYQRECGPISLSEVFYKLSDGILGRNSEIKQEKDFTWKTVQFIQQKFSKEWNDILALKNLKQTTDITDIDTVKEDNQQTTVDNASEIESDIDEQELEYKYDPSFRVLLDLDKEAQIEKKMKTKPGENIIRNKETEKKNKKKKKRKRKRKRENRNKICSIYATGLPLDISTNELAIFFKKAGVIARDIYAKGKQMINLYKKGDALITYHQPHSVQLAMDILDETEIRNGYPVHIQIANNNNKRKKRKLDGNEVRLKELYGVDAELTWDDDIANCVPKLHWIILQNMWNKQQIQRLQLENVDIEIFIDGLKNEVVSECERIGPIEKIEIYENNPNGFIKIKYKYPQHAKQCIDKMNKRYFDGNVIRCFYWDGNTDYKIYETSQQQEKRLKNFQNALQNS